MISDRSAARAPQATQPIHALSHVLRVEGCSGVKTPKVRVDDCGEHTESTGEEVRVVRPLELRVPRNELQPVPTSDVKGRNLVHDPKTAQQTPKGRPRTRGSREDVPLGRQPAGASTANR